MDINEFAKDVHRNAVEHGWWEGERSFAEIIALIHSEWSEALEEFRAGRPMVWHECMDEGQSNKPVVCEQCTDCYWYGKECIDRGQKPEGIAVELIDGSIRILDFAGKCGTHIFLEGLEGIETDSGVKPLPDFVADLHFLTAMATRSVWEDGTILDDGWRTWLGVAIFECRRYIQMHGLDPDRIMLEKHEYNKSRPYRHGGKTC